MYVSTAATAIIATVYVTLLLIPETKASNKLINYVNCASATRVSYREYYLTSGSPEASLVIAPHFSCQRENLMFTSRALIALDRHLADTRERKFIRLRVVSAVSSR